jgi:competence protein ComGC
MSLVGQKPAPSRVDGFWVKQLVTEEELEPTQTVNDPINTKDVEALAVWGRLLLKTVPPLEKQRQNIQQKASEARQAICKKEAEETQAVNQKMTEAIEALKSDPAQKETLDYLRTRNFNPTRTSKALEDLRQYLKNELSADELQHLIQLVHRHAPKTTTRQPPLRSKTDPLTHSVDVIKEME